MKIHAYEVEVKNGPSCGDLLRCIEAVPFEGRIRPTSGGDVRLDDLVCDNGIWLLDFVKHRIGHAPGIASATTKVQGVPLADGERFAEETAALFDESTGFMVIQYNHYGPRFGAIEDYLTDFAANGKRKKSDRGMVRLGARLRDDAYARLQSMQVVREVEFAISVPGVRQADRKAGRSLASILDAPLPGGLNILRVTMTSSGESGAGLDREQSISMVENLRQFGGEVKRLFVKAKSVEKAKTEEIDLLKDRLEVEIPLNLGTDSRYSQRDRWSALRDQYQEWRDSGDLATRADLAA